MQTKKTPDLHIQQPATENSSRSYDFLWFGIALFPLLVIATLRPLRPHDYWWYVRLGQDILASGRVPVVDTFSSIQAGQPVLYQSWLSAVIFWLIEKTDGVPLTFLLRTLLIGSAYAVLWGLVRQAGVGPRLAAILTLLAGLAGSNNWSMRPQLFAFPLFLAALWILTEWQRRENRHIWWLVPIGLVWANLHGSFILLFALAALHLLFGEGDRRSLLMVVLATLAVTFINPRGFVLWESVLKLYIAPGLRNLSPEWQAPRNEGWQLNIFFAWLILLGPAAAFASRRLSAFKWIMFITFSWLAVTAIRYVIWDVFVICILTAELIPEPIAARFDRPIVTRTPALNFGLGAVLLLMPLLLLPGPREWWWRSGPPLLDAQTPVAATAWLAGHPELPGPMWNDVVFGSYLIYALPSRPVWIDTRIQVAYTLEQGNQYLSVQAAEPGWDGFLEQKGVNLLMLARTQPALMEAVKNSPQWCGQYHDDMAAIFSRCQPIP